MFEQWLLILCGTAIAAALVVAYWYRPQPAAVAGSLFGPSQVEYERELHEKDLRIFELGQELKRAHDLVESKTELLDRMVDRWLTDSLAGAITRQRLEVANRRLRWNRARVRKLTPPRNNIIEFPAKRAGAA